MNNFQKLLEEEGSRMHSEESERILRNVWNNLGFIRMMSEVVDIYVSRVGGVMIMAAGAEDALPETSAPGTPKHRDTPEFPSPDHRLMKPGSPDGDDDRRP